MNRATGTGPLGDACAALDERAEALRTKAMKALRAAVKDGYRDRGYLEGEPDFAPLRDRGDYKALLEEVRITKS